MSKPLVSLELDVAGEEVINEALGGLIDIIGDMRPANEAQHATLNRYAVIRFKSGGKRGWRLGSTGGHVRHASGAVRGPGWVDYNDEPAYAGYKRGILKLTETELDKSILLWPGGNERLRPSFTDPSHPEHIWTNRRNGFEWGSRTPHAAVHQGARPGFQRWDKKRVPVRKIIERDPGLVKQLRANYQEYIEGAASVAFGPAAGQVTKTVGGIRLARVGRTGIKQKLLQQFAR